MAKRQFVVNFHGINLPPCSLAGSFETPEEAIEDFFLHFIGDLATGDLRKCVDFCIHEVGVKKPKAKILKRTRSVNKRRTN
jgi:hypothetical protein